MIKSKSTPLLWYLPLQKAMVPLKSIRLSKWSVMGKRWIVFSTRKLDIWRRIASNTRSDSKRKVFLPCFESNFLEAPSNTWWTNLGSTIHFANNIQGCLNLWNLVGSEQNIYVGNQMSSDVEAIGTSKLVLKSCFCLLLEITFYVLSFFRNSSSVSRLMCTSFSFLPFKLIKDNKVVVCGFLVVNLFKLSLDAIF